MTKPRTPRHAEARFLTIRLAIAAGLLAVTLAGCRRVEVADGPITTPPSGRQDAGTADPGLIGGIDQATLPPDAGSGGDPGLPSDAGTGPALGDAGAANGDAGGSGSPPDAATTRDGAPASLITDIKVLASGLTSLVAPAIGSEGASLLHYPSASQATIRFVGWNGAASEWYGAAGAYYLYVAASGTRHVALLYARSYGIYASGGTNELSGTPATYKEFLAASDVGYAWVDYEAMPDGGPGGGRPAPGPTPPLGKVVFQTWSGTRASLSDSLRYRARLDLSRTHLTFVEYAATGAVGQIVVQALAGGAPIVAAASARHQDRPAIDGDWVVWEEYLGPKDSVIRARNLVTGEVRELSATTGFRTAADLLGTRVVWEDQRAGTGDVYFLDLAGGGERVAVSGKGHSASPRLTADGLVWIESNAGTIGLAQARFVR